MQANLRHHSFFIYFLAALTANFEPLSKGSLTNPILIPALLIQISTQMSTEASSRIWDHKPGWASSEVWTGSLLFWI